MGSKAFLFIGVLIFTALLFNSDQVIARDLTKTTTYNKNEDGTIKPNGVGKVKNVYERSFGGGNDSGHRGIGTQSYDPIPCERSYKPCVKPDPYGPHNPPAYNRGYP